MTVISFSITSNTTMWWPAGKNWLAPQGDSQRLKHWKVTISLFGKEPLLLLSSWHRRLSWLGTHLGSVFSSRQGSDVSSILIITIRASCASTVWCVVLEIKLLNLIISVSKVSFYHFPESFPSHQACCWEKAAC